MANSKILTQEQEMKLRQPIDEYVGKIQKQIDDLRREGTDRVIAFQNSVDVAKRDKTLTTGERENRISECRAGIEKAKKVEAANKDSISKLITDAESLHSFNSMLNRTRRKDIQDFCIRRPYTLAVEFTPEQQALHDELLRFEQNALLQLHGDARSIPFMMSTIKRQASSCIFD